MAADSEARWIRANRENWDDRVAVHAASGFYDLRAFREGACTLRDFERTELGEVTGKRLLHLQCHMGQDTLSWARLGAEVTGLDFSAEAIRTARALAADTDLADRSRFVGADVYDAPEALGGQTYDIVYTGIGALVWLPDLPRWAAVVAALLRAGGRLYLVEFHPLSEALGPDGRTLTYDYFATGGAVYDEPHTYTDGPPLTKTVSKQWRHPVGEVVTALATAGLRLELLTEREDILFRSHPVLEEDGHGGYRFPPGHPRLPLMYTLRAAKPLTR